MNGFYKCRMRAGLTQMEVAEALHITQATVSSWETGISYPTGSKIPAIARLYGCRMEELFTGQSGPVKRRISRKRIRKPAD